VRILTALSLAPVFHRGKFNREFPSSEISAIKGPIGSPGGIKSLVLDIEVASKMRGDVLAGLEDHNSPIFRELWVDILEKNIVLLLQGILIELEREKEGRVKGKKTAKRLAK